MRSFLGRDILSLKDFERNEFFHVFEVARTLEPIATQSPQQRFAEGKDPGDGLLPTLYPHPTGSRSCHAPPGRSCNRFF